MGFLIMGSVVVMAAALLLVSVLRRKINNKKVLSFFNFLIFTSAIGFELVFIMQVLKWEKESMKRAIARDQIYDNNIYGISDPLPINLEFSTRRYEPYYGKVVVIPKEDDKDIKRIQELRKLKEEGKISQEVFDKAIDNLLKKEAK
jgi:hypothetical protein